MSNKKPLDSVRDSLGMARKRAAETCRRVAGKPEPAALLSAEELENAAPFYMALRGYIRQLKMARESAGITLAELATRTGLAVETLSRLETGALTNPTWKTLGVYAAAVGGQPILAFAAAPNAGAKTAVQHDRADS